MQILNISGYKFITLGELSTWQCSFKEHCRLYGLKGTILLSEEGININLSGTVSSIDAFKHGLTLDPRFADMRFHEFYSDEIPFRFMKVKVKKEIITMRQPKVTAQTERAPSIAPHTLKQWLDEHRDITLLDTRNDFEVAAGAFDGATNLHLNQFSQLPDAITQLDKNKPVVMYCTGGIRCEKAALYMQDQGFTDVYQLDGGILGYFKQVGAAHYTGTCFVFDERVAVDPISLHG